MDIREFIEKLEGAEQQTGLNIIIGCADEMDALRCDGCGQYDSGTKTRGDGCGLHKHAGVYPTINENILDIIE